ncbi:unnamed protein product [Closterium sp. Naga37s-1]|nr:unnamed protein product [Closterium sp. Naga37s-1]
MSLNPAVPPSLSFQPALLVRSPPPAHRLSPFIQPLPPPPCVPTCCLAAAYCHLSGLQQYDHFEFPGVVPRTFLGAMLVAGLSSPLVAITHLFGASKITALVIVRGTLGFIVFLSFYMLRRQPSFLSSALYFPSPLLHPSTLRSPPALAPSDTSPSGTPSKSLPSSPVLSISLPPFSTHPPSDRHQLWHPLILLPLGRPPKAFLPLQSPPALAPSDTSPSGTPSKSLPSSPVLSISLPPFSTHPPSDRHQLWHPLILLPLGRPPKAFLPLPSPPALAPSDTSPSGTPSKSLPSSPVLSISLPPFSTHPPSDRHQLWHPLILLPLGRPPKAFLPLPSPPALAPSDTSPSGTPSKSLPSSPVLSISLPPFSTHPPSDRHQLWHPLILLPLGRPPKAFLPLHCSLFPPFSLFHPPSVRHYLRHPNSEILCPAAPLAVPPALLRLSPPPQRLCSCPRYATCCPPCLLPTAHCFPVSLLLRRLEKCFLSQFHLPFYASRPLPNVFALALANLAFTYWIKGKAAQALQTLVFAFVVFRCDVLILLAPIGLSLLLTRSIGFFFAAFTCVLTGIASLMLTVSVDSVLWRRFPLWPEGMVLFFNTALNKSSEWGVSSPHWYFTSALPRALLLAYPLSFLGPILDRRMLRFFLPALTFVGLYSFLPHKARQDAG